MEATTPKGYEKEMPHPADFFDAHRRHWEDAELLFEHRRWANSDQLYGFSAECGLKAVMKSWGMPVDEKGSPKDPAYRKHVQELWEKFVTFARSKEENRTLDLLPTDEPFSHWSHEDRYAHRDPFREAGVRPHREAARRIGAMVNRVIEDGP